MDISHILETVVVPNPHRSHLDKEKNLSSRALEKSKKFISLRKKAEDSANYNLRGEIKAASKLKFDWLQDYSTPKKHKTKTVTESNKFLTPEEFNITFS